MTLIVVCHRPDAALLHRQAALGAIERLDLALFIYREDDGMGGRIDIETNDIAQLAHKLRVGKQLELFHPVLLQAVRAPDALDGILADVDDLRHHGGGPVGRLCGRVRLREDDASMRPTARASACLCSKLSSPSMATAEPAQLRLLDISVLVEPMLVVRRVLREQIGILHRRLLAIVRDDEVCRRLMTVPGVGPMVALTYRATVDVPARFRNSKAVGAVLGLTPAQHQSGESERPGAISKCGDEMMRVMLYEAAQIMLTRTNKWSWLKAWAMKIARHRGMKKAIVALARRLAVIMHRIWVDGTEFRWTREVAAA